MTYIFSLRLTYLKENWKTILRLLNDLENWLETRETIASNVDYNSSELSRNVYLEGIKTFEVSFLDSITILSMSIIIICWIMYDYNFG